MTLSTTKWLIGEALQPVKRPYCQVFGHDWIEASFKSLTTDGFLCARCRKVKK